MGRNNLTGAWGEALAAQYLQKKRFKIIATNYRTRFGEIDLIVEVKLRKSDAFANAFEYVDLHKQERLRTTAGIYLSQHPTDLQPRFDVIEIYAPQGTQTLKPQIHHMEDAFQ